MPTVGQIYYNVIDNNSGSYVSSGQNIFSDIVVQVGASQFNKVGVQAPAGTKIVMNESKTIMVGRTGIYELDDDIAITNMYFIRPRKYEKDEEASQQAIEQGTAGMQAADKKRSEDLERFYKEIQICQIKIPIQKGIRLIGTHIIIFRLLIQRLIRQH